MAPIASLELLDTKFLRVISVMLSIPLSCNALAYSLA